MKFKYYFLVLIKFYIMSKLITLEEIDEQIMFYEGAVAENMSSLDLQYVLWEHAFHKFQSSKLKLDALITLR